MDGVDNHQAPSRNGRRFPAELAATGRFAPDKPALRHALRVVRALDADSYQALLWALGLEPDARLSSCGAERRTAGGQAAWRADD